MDVIVIDVPNAWGMLFSENWATCFGGNIQMDLSYATIPTCEGTYVTLHREPTMRYQVEYQWLKSIDMGIKWLKSIGESNIIILKVKRAYVPKN